MTAPGFSVVVAVGRPPESLGRLWRCLEAQTLPRSRFEIVLAFDGVAAARFPHIFSKDLSAVFVELKRRSGPACARNAGAARARGEVLVFTDDDCAPPAEWLSHVARRMESPTAPDIVGGAAAQEGKNLVAAYLRQMGFLSPALAAEPELALTTANLAVRRRWFERLGGFNEGFALAAGEDLDFILRAASAGARLGYDPDFDTLHVQPASLASLCERYFRYGRSEIQAARLRHGLGAKKGWLDLVAGLPRWLSGSSRLNTRADGVRPWPRRMAFRALAAIQTTAFQSGRWWEGRRA